VVPALIGFSFEIVLFPMLLSILAILRSSMVFLSFWLVLMALLGSNPCGLFSILSSRVFFRVHGLFVGVAYISGISPKETRYLQSFRKYR